ncbi:uncharacterized protein LOC135485188 [Lineus longissimus]|uniref:uncharacterized protein LOC135485188 n=1 Tax=Lineus longissimus TaxID=88925 RepID=UPI002B4E6673
MSTKKPAIVINCYTNSESEGGEEPKHYTELKGFLEETGYEIDQYTVDIDKTQLENLVSEIEKAKHTISVVTENSIQGFFGDENHYQKWLRSLHKCLDSDNVLTHIIFCINVDVKNVPWYLRQFNPCISYSHKNHDWKVELRNVLKLEKKSVKTLKHVNAGEALAWSHYTGFVRFLPMVGSGGDPKDECVWQAQDGKPVINNLVILIPSDCHCPATIEHPSIQGRQKSKYYTFHRAGKERKLNVDLYTLEGEDKLVPISSTPSIETLRLMKEDKGLDEMWLQEQKDRFTDVLKDRIESDGYLRRKVILITDYNKDNEDFVKNILRETKQAHQDQQSTTSYPGKEGRWSVYLRSEEDDADLAKKIEGIIKEEIPDLIIENRETRKCGEREHNESLVKIRDVDQCIFLLTEHKGKISADYEVSECVDKVMQCSNKRATILLYTEEAEKKHKDYFKQLAEHVVTRVQYGKDGWVNELKEAITDIQARPLKSAVNFHNLSEGLAFGYLYGYMRPFLPEFSKKLEELKISDVMPKKLIILMPKSGYSPKTLQATVNDDKHLKELEGPERKTKKISYRYGLQDRDYTVTEYRLTDDDQKEYFVAAEFLTPLQALTDMQKDVFADMSIEQKCDLQRNLRKVMLEIVKSKLIPEDIVDKFLLLEIEDEGLDGKPTTDAEKLHICYRELLKTVKEELRREQEKPEEQAAQQIETMEIK